MNTNDTYLVIEGMMKKRGGVHREILFPMLFNHFGFKTGAEVGVSQGLHALTMLQNTSIYLYLVDNYRDHECGCRGKNGDQRYQDALTNLKSMIDAKRCSLIRANSVDAAKDIPDNSLDFCYIDADHSYDGIKTDVEAWYPKIKHGGIISGHDYKNRRPVGVIKFVNEFIAANQLKLIILGGRGKGWLVVKP